MFSYSHWSFDPYTSCRISDGTQFSVFRPWTPSSSRYLAYATPPTTLYNPDHIQRFFRAIMADNINTPGAAAPKEGNIKSF